MKIIKHTKTSVCQLLALITSINAYTVQHSERLLPNKQAEIAELCFLTGLTPTIEATISTDTVKIACEQWKRPAGKERWEFTFGVPLSPEQTQRSYQLFNSLGFFAECVAKKQAYTHACVFGATIPAMYKRFSYLISLWNKGIRWQHTVLLTGDRPLSPTADVMPDGTMLSATTETEAMIALWKHLCDTGIVPLELQQIPTVQVAVPREKLIPGATIEQMITDLHTQYTGSPSYLFISSQPYVLYQGLMVDYAFRNLEAEKEVVGAAFSPTATYNIGVLFDTLARCLEIQNKLDH